MTPTRSRVYTTEGVVLRQFDLGEADRLITLVTPDRGLVRAVARGARRPTSKVGGHVDLLRRISLSVRVGRTIDALSQVETLESFVGLQQHLGLTLRALYLAELAERFSVEDAPSSTVYQLLLNGLRFLETAPDPNVLMRWFEIHLLGLTGFRPELKECVDCGAVLDPQEHTFSAARGGIVCPKCRPVGGDILLPASVATIKLLRHLNLNAFPSVASLKINSGSARQAERVLRQHITHVLDRSIYSADLLDDLRKWNASVPSQSVHSPTTEHF